MEFSDVLRQRRSIRAFSDQAVPDELVRALLEESLASPSWSNTQPYKIGVLSGADVAPLGRELTERFHRLMKIQRQKGVKRLLAAWRDRGALPDGDFRPVVQYPADLQPRRVATGHGLYELLGIARGDKAARDEQMARNFSFFDAPVVLFLFAHKGLGVYSALDAGIFLQSLMLAAANRGLGTCAQGALGLWRSPVAARFDIPEPYQLLCGVALGYPAPDAPINRFQPPRVGLEELLLPRA